MNDINLNSLKIFLEVANSKSFLEASNKLFLSQPAISKSMSKLEEDLNVTLFYRANKGISLTSSGEILYQYLKDTKDLLLSCERVLTSLNDIEEGKIIIGVRSHLVRNYLMDKISDFRNKHPKIKIKLIDISTKQMIEQLEERKIDFIVDSTPIESIYNNLDIIPICELKTGFVKSVNNSAKINSLSDLEHQNIILPASRGSLRKNLNNCLNELDIKLNPILEFETEELIIDAVRKNLGIGYVITNAIQYLVDSKVLEYINLKEELPGTELDLVIIKNYLTNVAKLFIEEEILNEQKIAEILQG